MSWQLYFGAILGVFAVIGAGIWSGIRSGRRGVSTSGRRSLGTFLVTGSLLGAITGGASTIGTAQLAYTYGFSAWWFTLGAGLACLVLLLAFGRRFYTSGNETLTQFIAPEYGQKAACIAALLMSLGNLLSIVSQLLSGVALIETITPLGGMAAGVIVVALMISYILFGGMRGSGVTGLVKCALLYLCCAVCGIIVLRSDGGWSALRASLPAEQFFNLLARGAATDLGAGLSLVLGIITTQTYFQVLSMSRTFGVYSRSCLLGTLLIPPIGFAAVLVGLYMRVHSPDISPSAALPLFIIEKLPPVVAGVCIGALLITVVGAGAGLTMGIASTFTHDVYRVYVNPNAAPNTLGRITNLLIVLIPCLSLVSLLGSMSSMILSWSFLALGLRGTVFFAPLIGAICFPGKIAPRFALAAIIAGPLATILSKLFLTLPLDPVFPGLFAALLIMAAGLAVGKAESAGK